MPTYTYNCIKCGNTFEKILKMLNYKDPESEPCPECGEQNSIIQVINAKMEIVPEHALGRIRPHRDWQNHLNNLKRKNPGSDFTTW